MNIRQTLYCLFALLLISSCGSSIEKHGKRKLMVYSASSLTNVMNELVDSFELNKSISVQVNYASSGTLIRQIDQGAKADLFITASEDWMKYAIGKQYIKESKQKVLAQNKLVLIGQKALSWNEDLKSLNWDLILNGQRFAIGDPLHVPAGEYAEQAMGYLGWTKQLQGQLVKAKDVRSALTWVEMKECPYGIVYATDVKQSRKIVWSQSLPQDAYSKVNYYVGNLSNTDNSDEFYSFLSSDLAKKVLLKYGFNTAGI